MSAASTTGGSRRLAAAVTTTATACPAPAGDEGRASLLLLLQSSCRGGPGHAAAPNLAARVGRGEQGNVLCLWALDRTMMCECYTGDAGAVMPVMS